MKGAGCLSSTPHLDQEHILHSMASPPLSERPSDAVAADDAAAPWYVAVV